MIEIGGREFLRSLKLVSPGTPLREGLEIILQGKTGGLIVVAEDEEVFELLDGGFKVNSPLTPPALAELAKMDGAIILSRDLQKILLANVTLVPDPSIPTRERGTRHKAAERTARQTGALVIAISQTRNIISLYKGNKKYVLKNISELLGKASQALQTLEKYRSSFEETLLELDILEFQDEVRLFNVVRAIQRFQAIRKIKEEIEKYTTELGREAHLLKMQLKEITQEVIKEGEAILRDYTREDREKTEERLNSLGWEEILEPSQIVRILGYGTKLEALDSPVFPRGFRILSRIPRLPQPVVENLVKAFGDLPNIMKATTPELTDVEDVGEKRATIIKKELERLKERALLRKY